MLCAFVSSCGKKDETGKASGIHHAEIEIQDYGTIKLELDGDEAPLTVQNCVRGP